MSVASEFERQMLDLIKNEVIKVVMTVRIQKRLCWRIDSS